MTATLLAIACLPTLLLNVGTGRSVLLHQHQGSSFHAHVLTEPSYAHEHHHGDHGHAHQHDAPALPPEDEHEGTPAAGDATTPPVERHDNGKLIKGAEVAAVKRQHTDGETAVALFHAVPFVMTGRAPPVEPPVRAHGRRLGVGRTQLSSLRVVVLLI